MVDGRGSRVEDWVEGKELQGEGRAGFDLQDSISSTLEKLLAAGVTADCLLSQT